MFCLINQVNDPEAGSYTGLEPKKKFGLDKGLESSAYRW